MVLFLGIKVAKINDRIYNNSDSKEESDMEIKKGLNCFYLGESETNHDAIITYFDYGKDVVAIGHTFVKEELRGQSIAHKLLDKVVAMAREGHLKIAPMCSYAYNIFERENEYSDVYYK